MEDLLNRESSVGQLWLASHWLTKLNKQLIVKFDVQEQTTAMLNSDSSLRTIGYLLLGLVRILSRKVQYIIHEVSSLLDSFAPKEKPRRQVFTTVKPKKTKAFTTQLSASSFKASRDSIENPRNLAQFADITIPDSYHTPISPADIPLQDGFLDDIASLQGENDIQVELFRTPTLDQTPALSEPRSRRRLSRKKIEVKNMKRQWVADKKVTLKLTKDSSDLVRPLNAATIREIPLNTTSLFGSTILKELPKELSRFFQEGVWVGGSKQVEEPYMELEPFGFTPQQQDYPEDMHESFERGTEMDIVRQSDTEETSCIQTKNEVMKKLRRQKEVKFSKVFNRRVEAARGFYDLLVLAHRNEFVLEQNDEATELFIRPALTTR